MLRPHSAKWVFLKVANFLSTSAVGCFPLLRHIYTSCLPIVRPDITMLSFTVKLKIPYNCIRFWLGKFMFTIEKINGVSQVTSKWFKFLILKTSQLRLRSSSCNFLESTGKRDFCRINFSKGKRLPTTDRRKTSIEHLSKHLHS